MHVRLTLAGALLASAWLAACGAGPSSPTIIEAPGVSGSPAVPQATASGSRHPLAVCEAVEPEGETFEIAIKTVTAEAATACWMSGVA